MLMIKDMMSLRVKLNSFIKHGNPPEMTRSRRSTLITDVDTISTKGNFILKSIEEDIKEVEKPTEKYLLKRTNDIDNFAYSQAVVFDNRSFMTIVIKLYLEVEKFTRVLFPSSEYEYRTISINYIVFNLCMTFTLNGIFYTDEQLSTRYKNEKLTVIEDLLRSIPSSIITAILSGICNSLLSYPNYINIIIAEAKNSQISEIMQKYYKKIIINVIFFHSLLVLVICFTLYYLTLFCLIYKNSQMSWFLGSVYSIGISLLTNVFVAIGLAIMRVTALRYKSKYTYNLELYIRQMI